jgi:hypothetical protein
MLLHQVVATGKKIRRGTMGDFVSVRDFLDEIEEADILATDYEVAPDVAITVTKAKFDAAWEASRAGSNSIKAAGQSEFYKRLAAQLGILD